MSDEFLQDYDLTYTGPFCGYRLRCLYLNPDKLPDDCNYWVTACNLFDCDPDYLDTEDMDEGSWVWLIKYFNYNIGLHKEGITEYGRDLSFEEAKKKMFKSLKDDLKYDLGIVEDKIDQQRNFITLINKEISNPRQVRRRSSLRRTGPKTQAETTEEQINAIIQE